MIVVFDAVVVSTSSPPRDLWKRVVPSRRFFAVTSDFTNLVRSSALPVTEGCHHEVPAEGN